MQELRMETQMRELQFHEWTNNIEGEWAVIRKREAQIQEIEEHLQQQQKESEDKIGPLPRIGSLGQQRGNKDERTCVTNVFDGHWILNPSNGRANKWMRSFQIQGDKVILGDGNITCLTYSREGQPQLESGPLFLQNDILYRVGKSMKVATFRRFGGNRFVQIINYRKHENKHTVVSMENATPSKIDITDDIDLDDSPQSSSTASSTSAFSSLLPGPTAMAANEIDPASQDVTDGSLSMPLPTPIHEEFLPSLAAALYGKSTFLPGQNDHASHQVAD
eukprot:2815152-Karenia_brevis.AAC.3